MLSVRKLSVEIHGSPVLRDISFEVGAGALVYLIGRNGAGKTTSFRTIMGFRRPSSGSIELDGRDIVGLRPFEIARMGVGFAPEESEVFADLTVSENVAIPTWAHAGHRRPADRLAEAYRVFPRLAHYRERSGQALSGGERKMVSIARALALGPKLLLLDEPTEGLSPTVIPSIIEGIASIRAHGHAVFIAESNVHHVPEIADQLYVIERGEIIFAGKSEGARENPLVARIAGAALPPRSAVRLSGG
jgi:branched-chain amino acid transport system ATP-binding protein